MRSLYKGRIIELRLETVALPDGRRFELEMVHHPGGAAVVALDDGARLCLLRQYRHAAGGWLWELPAGKLAPGEPPLETARRELVEEAGLKARRWDPLGRLHSSPGVFTEIIHLYLARGLHRVPQCTGAEELIEVHWVAFPEALQWALQGRITDAKTLIGLFRAQGRLSPGELTGFI